MMLLYTNSVIETRRRGEFFGQERLKYLMRRKGTTAEGLPPLILDRVLGFSNGTLTDDIGVPRHIVRSIWTTTSPLRVSRLSGGLKPDKR